MFTRGDVVGYVFFFKQKTAYEMRISDWSSDVCSSDLGRRPPPRRGRTLLEGPAPCKAFSRSQKALICAGIQRFRAPGGGGNRACPPGIHPLLSSNRSRGAGQQ